MVWVIIIVLTMRLIKRDLPSPSYQAIKSSVVFDEMPETDIQMQSQFDLKFHQNLL